MSHLVCPAVPPGFVLLSAQPALVMHHYSYNFTLKRIQIVHYDRSEEKEKKGEKDTQSQRPKALVRVGGNIKYRRHASEQCAQNTFHPSTGPR